MNFRRIVVAALTVVVSGIAYACANPNAPPGGPPDAAAPVIMKISPATGTIGAKPKSVVFQFDEVVSESPKGAQDLSALVFISPKSVPDVSWHRSSIDIKPSKGWKPNTVYSITLAPGIMDLHNNAIDTSTSIVFSTGGSIPLTKIRGVAFDWQLGRGASKAIVEAIAPGKDSVTYQTIADSAGRYVLEHVPPGQYVMRAFVDRNSNRSIESTEPWDSVSVTLQNTAAKDFYAFQHDTVGLRIADLAVIDSGTRIHVTFDKALGLAQAFATTQFVLQKADSSSLNVETVFTGPQKLTLDSLKAKATADSIAKAQPPLDTSLAARSKRDSVAKIKLRDSLALADRQAGETRRLAALRGNKPVPPKDTMPLPKMARPALFNDLYIRMATPLEPNTPYRLTIRNVRSLSGTIKSPNRAFRTAPKEVPKDSVKTKSAKDTLQNSLIKR